MLEEEVQQSWHGVRIFSELWNCRLDERGPGISSLLEFLFLIQLLIKNAVDETFL
jgi:hypothetical protein